LQLFVSMGYDSQNEENILMQQPDWNNRSVHESQRLNRSGLFGVVAGLKEADSGVNANSVVVHPYTVVNVNRNEYDRRDNGLVSVMSVTENRTHELPCQKGVPTTPDEVNEAFRACFGVYLTDILEPSIKSAFQPPRTRFQAIGSLCSLLILP
jgi:hypothetical protein